jgi:hypothetical protein
VEAVTVAEFLAARLDEDEAAAKGWVFRGTVVMLTEGEPTQADAEYLATFSGDRVLREVAAKRAILAEFVSFREEHERQRAALPAESLGVGPGVHTGTELLRAVVAGHAAVYSDHPDYDPDWRLEP